MRRELSHIGSPEVERRFAANLHRLRHRADALPTAVGPRSDRARSSL